MNNLRYMDPKNWGDIERGYVFDAAMLYHSKRPLKFFVPDDDDANRGRLVDANGDFSPVMIDGSPRAREQQVVVTVKPRKIIVLSTDLINKSSDFEYIHVAPLFSISKEDREKSWYPLVKEDRHVTFLLVPGRKGYERYADLSQMTSIHKGLLLNRQEKVGEDRMEQVNDMLLNILELGILQEVQASEIIEETGN